MVNEGWSVREKCSGKERREEGEGIWKGRGPGDQEMAVSRSQVRFG